ncbi:MAG TPA: hypothetical protein VF728_09180, partial [Nocardioides sp.]
MPNAQVVPGAGAIVFVDVASERAGGWAGEVADQLRFVDETALAGREVVVVRAPSPADEPGWAQVADLVEQRTGHRPTVAEA